MNLKSTPDCETASPLLSVQDLHVHYPVRQGLLRRITGRIRAVDGVSFHVTRGKTLGVVGESGSGKTTLGRAIIRLAPITEGCIAWEGHRISGLSPKEFFPWRRRIQMIFQDPWNSLNPRMTIYSIVAEPLEIHFPQLKATEKRDRVAALLQRVGLEPSHMNRYPHQFSGGQRQRIGIARALAVEPELIICDEPVSALDVSVQARIINLLQDLQEELGLTYIFIAHDLGVIEHISDDILVMQHGRIVEQGPTEQVHGNPEHPYTRQLLEAVPRVREKETA